jgi:hypothetical protein
MIFNEFSPKRMRQQLGINLNMKFLSENWSVFSKIAHWINFILFIEGLRIGIKD